MQILNTGRFADSMLPKTVTKGIVIDGLYIECVYVPGEPIVAVSCKGFVISVRIEGRKTEKLLRKAGNLMIACMN